MILDKALELADAQIVTASAASTNTIDFGQTYPNTGMSNGFGGLHAAFTVATQLAGADEITLKLQHSDDAKTFYDLEAAPITTAQFNNIGVFYIKMPLIHKRYLRAYFDLGSGKLTAGAISVGLTTSIQLNPNEIDYGNANLAAPETPQATGS